MDLGIKKDTGIIPCPDTCAMVRSDPDPAGLVEAHHGAALKHMLLLAQFQHRLVDILDIHFIVVRQEVLAICRMGLHVDEKLSLQFFLCHIRFSFARGKKAHSGLFRSELYYSFPAGFCTEKCLAQMQTFAAVNC